MSYGGSSIITTFIALGLVVNRLRGTLKVFLEDGAGNRAETMLGPWDCVSCPAHVIHGFENVGVEPAYLQVMLGKARPDLMTYSDPALQQRRAEHLDTASRTA